jgi:hypothetical protein
MYICIYVHTIKHVSAHLYICIHLYTYISILPSKYVMAKILARCGKARPIYVYVYMYICIYVHTIKYVSAHLYICIYLCTYISELPSKYVIARSLARCENARSMYVYMYVCTYN